MTPVGAFAPVRVNTRVLAATHKPLDVMVQNGQFRADLYARLSGFVFAVPALRDRMADLGILVQRILASKEGTLPRLRPEVALLLLGHPFPRNVRELVQIIDASFALAEGGVVRVGDLPAYLRDAPVASTSPPGLTELSPEDRAIRDELRSRLDAHDGNVSQVAREMGKARQQIQRWIRRFGLRGSS